MVRDYDEPEFDPSDQMNPEPTDAKLLELLKEIDEDDDVEVTSWEADFLESVVYRNPKKSLSEKQRATAIKIINEYCR